MALGVSAERLDARCRSWWDCGESGSVLELALVAEAFAARFAVKQKEKLLAEAVRIELDRGVVSQACC